MLAVLGLASLGTKAIIAFVAILSYTGFVGWKAYQMGQSDCVQERIETLVMVATQTKEVAVLDAESLTKALKKQQEQFLKDRANDTEFATIIKTDPVFIKSECTINADSLRLWNAENQGVED